MSKTILITGAGSGFGKIVAFELAQRGHRVIATTQIWPQVTELRSEAREKGLSLEVDKLDVTDARDRSCSARWDVDVLVSNAGTMEAGPVAELPLDLLRSMFEVNFFGSVALAQLFAAKMVAKRSGKIVFSSSLAGLLTVPYSAGYSASKHALEAFAEGLKTELSPFGIQIATVNPGFYATGFNDRGVDSASHWFDPKKNFTPMEAFASAAQILAQQADPRLMANTIVDVVLAEKPRFRNVLPKETEDLIKQVQHDTWEAKA
jgi:short-subunit dehydrogenase